MAHKISATDVENRFAKLRHAASCPMFCTTDDGRKIQITEWTATTKSPRNFVTIELIGFIDQELPTNPVDP